MSISDTARRLAAKAQAYAAGNKDKIEQGVQKATQAADAKTGGKYHDQISKAGQKADEYLDKLPDPNSPPAAPDPRVDEAGDGPKLGPTP